MPDRSLRLICTHNGESEALRLLEWMLAGSASAGECHLFFTLDGVLLMEALTGPEQPAQSAVALAWLERHGFASLQLAFTTMQEHLTSRSACRSWCEIHAIGLPDGYEFSSLPVVLSEAGCRVVQL